MKRVSIFSLLLCLFVFPAFAQTKQDQPPRYNILLTGASFASPENRWFEMGCSILNATPINRAIGGEAIANAANRMELGYQIPFTRENYAAAFDYVIKRYVSDCYELRNNPDSRYYGSKAGKPAVIVLCTHWHDARTIYNTSVRRLAEKWGLPLVEFDKKIGFSKNTLHPVTKEQYSILYSTDTQVIDGVAYNQ